MLGFFLLIYHALSTCHLKNVFRLVFKTHIWSYLMYSLCKAVLLIKENPLSVFSKKIKKSIFLRFWCLEFADFRTCDSLIVRLMSP